MRNFCTFIGFWHLVAILFKSPLTLSCPCLICRSLSTVWIRQFPYTSKLSILFSFLWYHSRATWRFSCQLMLFHSPFIKKKNWRKRQPKNLLLKHYSMTSTNNDLPCCKGSSQKSKYTNASTDTSTIKDFSLMKIWATLIKTQLTTHMLKRTT